jgi:hypothetical protein
VLQILLVQNPILLTILVGQMVPPILIGLVDPEIRSSLRKFRLLLFLISSRMTGVEGP